MEMRNNMDNMNAFLNRLMKERDSKLTRALSDRAVLQQPKDDSGVNSVLRGLFASDAQYANVNPAEAELHSQTLDHIARDPSLAGLVASLFKKDSDEQFDNQMTAPLDIPNQSWDRLPMFDQARFQRAPRRF